MNPGKLIIPNEYQNEDDDSILQDCIPSTNQGEVVYEVVEETPKGHYVNGHVILNQRGSICSRAKHHIKSYQLQKHFLQRIISTTSGDYIPLLYPISMLFPSIGYKMIPSCGSIAGIIPSLLMVFNTSISRFAHANHYI